VSSRRSGCSRQLGKVSIGALTDPARLLVSTPRRLGVRTARPKTRLCTMETGIVSASIRDGGRVLKMFPYDPNGH
jgi:hypothetical protein